MTRKPKPKPVVPRAVLTIPEFCVTNHICTSMYYKVRKAGRGPREGRAGRKVTITFEAAAEWRAKNEQGWPQEAG